MSLSRTFTLVVPAALCACVAVSVATARTASTPRVAENTCPIVSASGNQGGSGSTGSNFSSTGTAGGVALGNKALGALIIDCDNYSDGLTITAPGHTFSLTKGLECELACVACKATNAKTLTCKLSVDQEKVGVKAVGSWQAAVNWLYALNDEAATNTTDGTCHITIVAELTLGGKQTFTKKDLSACAYAKGDVVQ